MMEKKGGAFETPPETPRLGPIPAPGPDDKVPPPIEMAVPPKSPRTQNVALAKPEEETEEKNEQVEIIGVKYDKTVTGYRRSNVPRKEKE